MISLFAIGGALFGLSTGFAATNIKDVLSRPLITGASVSADYGTQSPGKRLALKYTALKDIRTIAKSGAPGKETLKNLKEADLKDRTIIIALDLFFWDSAQADPTESIAALNGLIKQARQQSIPLVLGNIPLLLPGYQPSAKKFNDQIATACQSSKDCFVMPLEHYHQQLMANGYLESKGRKLTLKEIVPDGLHLSPAAADFLADELLNLLSHKI